MKTKKKIGDVLLEKGLITTERLEEALQLQRTSGQRLGEVLVEKGYVSDEQMVDAVSERLGIPRISLESMVIDPNVIQKVSVDLARRYTLIPVFAVGKTLTLAMADPLNIIAIDEIKYIAGLDIQRTIATTAEIKAAIDEYYSVADSMHSFIDARDEAAESERRGRQESSQVEETEAPVVKLVNLIISKAVKDKAADIHIEPEEARLRIRYRIDGVMREEAAPPKSMQAELISRVKIAADLDVSEQRIPQDGRLRVNVDGAPIDLRISTLPTIHGEKIVIRVLDRRSLQLTFANLGFDQTVEDTWDKIIRKPEGLVLITGPTSSGKTSTLYTTLQGINSVEKNIITVEDPVEYSLPLIVQIQINEKAGLTFPSTLRAMLRQNPDIIMIGEIRDRETAQMAIRSALTGHLVFSTMHTNDAPSAVARLVDMGIEPYLVASAVKGVLAQRLVRLNCPGCLESYEPSATVLDRAGLSSAAASVIDFRRGVGCKQCKETGFKGLTGVYELMSFTNRLSEMVLDGSSNARFREEARRAGYRPLIEAGMDKVSKGLLCLEELIKQTSSVEDMVVSEPAASMRTANVDTV
jgi:type IV pilus assembly protein PilB